MTEPIHGKVARVLNSQELVINVGSENSVTVGMYFDVVYPYGTIRDPDTKKVLGSIKRTKVRVRVTEVQEKLAVASTFRSTRVNIGGAGRDFGSFARALMPPKWITKYETFKKSDREVLNEDIDDEDSYVKVGDPVIQVIQVIEDIDVETGEKKANT